MTAAVDQAYKGMVPIGKFGFVILNVEMDPQKLDVNVHPAKLEVRFQEETTVFKAVYHAIKAGLGKGELVENVEQPVLPKKENEEPKEEIKLEIKEGMSVEERIHAINSVIKQITPKKKFEVAKAEEKIVPQTPNLIEDIYRNR